MDPPEYPGPPVTNAPPSTSTPNLLPPAPEPIVLSWNPLQEVDSQSSLHGASSSTAVLDTNSLGTTPQENPPGYAAARRPTEPITYSFSTLSFNSMILIPPQDAPDTRPLYRITVTMNCFVPTSFITTIVRGANEYGDYVGEFEMGSNKRTVLIRQTEYPIVKLLNVNYGPKSSYAWLRNGKPYIIWSFKTLPPTCRLPNKEQTLLATFYPAIKLGRPREPPVLSQLEVRPEGHEYFDDLLMALLIFEREPSHWERFAHKAWQ